VEIKSAMLTSGAAHPGKIFSEPSASVADVIAAVGALGEARSIVGAIGRYLFLNRARKSALKAALSAYGVLSGESLKGALAELFASRLEISVEVARSITFEDFVRSSGRILKIVASDVWSGRPKVFSRGQTPQTGVIDALVASAAFPGAFAPVRDLPTDPSAVLVDGGLASNTPAFLFYDEWRRGRMPTVVFQLTSSHPGGHFPASLVDYAGGLIRTAVNAGDEIIGAMLPFTRTIDLSGLEQFAVIDPHLRDVGVHQMFEIGRSRAEPRLRDMVEFRRASSLRPATVTDFARRYGAPGPFDTALSALRLQVGLWMLANARALPSADDLRVAVFLPVWDVANGKDLERVCWAIGFEFGFGSAPDRAIELSYGEGCVGMAVKLGQTTLDDTRLRRHDPSGGGLTAAHLELVPADRGSVVAIPVREYNLDAERPDADRAIVAVLALDSSLSLRDTGWAEMTCDDGPAAAHTDLLRIIEPWAALVARLLYA